MAGDGSANSGDSPNSSPALKATRTAALAVPVLGIMGAIQGSAPNIASSALVSVSRDLGMTGAQTTLTASVQTMLIAATVITTGLMADRLGRRRVLSAGLLLGALGSVICAIAPATFIYVLGQAVLGVGLGAVYGASFAYVRAVAQPGKLPQAIGVFGASVGITTVLLTLAGQSLVGVSWRIAILVSGAASVLMFFVVPLVLPKQPRIKGASLDVLGQVMLGIGIIGFLLGVSQTGRSLTAPLTLVPLLIGTLLIAGFFVWESRSSGAFYPVRLFRHPVFIAALIAGMVYNLGTAVIVLQTTNLWQYVTDVSSSALGLWQVPFFASGVVSALVVGRLMTRGMTNGTALLISAIVVASGFILLGLVATQKSFWAFLPGLVLAGVGLVGASIPFGNLIIREAPPAQFGPVTSSRTTVGQFWYSIGLALGTVLVDRMTRGGVVDRLEAAGVQPDQIGTAVTAVTMFGSKGTEPSTQLGKQALADAVVSYSAAFSTTMYLTAGIAVLGGIVGFLLLRKAENPDRQEKGASHAV